jgi:hypothetical protein
MQEQNRKHYSRHRYVGRSSCQHASKAALSQTLLCRIFACCALAGGDNSDEAIGTFFEGVLTVGYSTDAADDAVQANIVAASYTLA